MCRKKGFESISGGKKARERKIEETIREVERAEKKKKKKAGEIAGFEKCAESTWGCDCRHEEKPSCTRSSSKKVKSRRNIALKDEAEKKNTARRGSLSQVIHIITRVLNTLTEKGSVMILKILREKPAHFTIH